MVPGGGGEAGTRAGFRNREGERRKWRGTAASSFWSYPRDRKERKGEE